MRKPRRSKHRGVLLIAPKGPKKPTWKLRYRDPETGKVRDQVLSPEDAKTAETREAAALRVHKHIGRRRDDIGAGASPHRAADLRLSDAVQKYFDSHPHLRERTQRAYRVPCDLFLEWAARGGLRTVRQLTRGRLVDFKAYRVKAPKRSHVQGGKRGEVGETGASRSAFTVNKELRAVAIVLGWLSDAELVRLTRDDIRIGLKRIDTESVTRREYLTPAQARALLSAADRHDAICFKATRDEHAAGEQGRTPRYAPIAPFIRFVLLTGCRLGEALALTWENIRLPERRIEIRAEQTKTKHDRTIELDVCPSLVKLLERLQPAAGGTSRVFAPHTADSVNSTRRRLQRDKKAPRFDYQTLRVTAATYLACMPSFGPVLESRQLGHSIMVAEKHYIGRIRVSPETKTLEQALELELESAD